VKVGALALAVLAIMVPVAILVIPALVDAKISAALDLRFGPHHAQTASARSSLINQAHAETKGVP
jgi:hypothetical protein